MKKPTYIYHFFFLFVTTLCRLIFYTLLANVRVFTLYLKFYASKCAISNTFLLLPYKSPRSRVVNIEFLYGVCFELFDLLCITSPSAERDLFIKTVYFFNLYGVFLRV